MSSALLNQDFVLPIMVSNRNQRQSYIFDLIFKQLLGLDYKIIGNEENTGKYLDYSGAISAFSVYRHEYLQSETFTIPAFKQGVINGKEFPFFDSSKDNVLPFDPFATCFYFLTRHEELNALDLDRHQRFKPENSWLWRHGWRFEPIVNYIANVLKEQIEGYFFVEIRNTNQYKVCPSVDIDNAYAYYGRGKSMMASLMKSLVKFDFKELDLKFRSLRNKELDPYNTHRLLVEQLEKYHANCTVFFLMKSGGLNSNHSPDLMKDVVELYETKGFEIGIHPSYNVDRIQLNEEKKLLENFSKTKITKTRHHFIATKPHVDYPLLSELGLENDFSMAYASATGFRAGICMSYPWFDLKSNRVMDFTVSPFCFMDASYIFYNKYTVKTAVEELEEIIKTVKKYKGELHFVVHNEALSNVGVYKGWGEFLNKTLRVCD